MAPLDPWTDRTPHPENIFTRRAVVAGALGSALLGLAACGGETDGAGQSASAGGGERAVRHKYGTTTLSGTPKKVVTLGYIDQEPVLGLGVRPVGVVDFFGERPYGKWPWEKDLWASDPPQIVGERDEYEFEKIAKLQPDLIIGLYSGMTRQNYDTLSKIAPTVAQPRGYRDFAAPWQVMTQMAGASLGKADEAKELVASTTAKLTAARTSAPERKGQTVAVVEPFKADQWAVFGAADPKLQFMEQLGFTTAPSVRKLEPGGDVATLSTERLDLLDVDRLVLLVDTGDQTEQQVRANPLFTRLDVARQDRATFVPFSGQPPVGAALAFNSVLSIPYGITTMTRALDG